MFEWKLLYRLPNESMMKVNTCFSLKSMHYYPLQCGWCLHCKTSIVQSLVNNSFMVHLLKPAMECVFHCRFIQLTGSSIDRVIFCHQVPLLYCCSLQDCCDKQYNQCVSRNQGKYFYWFLEFVFFSLTRLNLSVSCEGWC